MTIERYSVSQFVDDLRRITAETADNRSIINRVRPLAKRLATVCASENGDYYQVAFENTDPACDAADPPRR